MKVRTTSLALLGLVLSGCGPTLPPPREGHHFEWITDYAIDLEVDEADPSRGHFGVRFDYATRAVPKQSGFKFFGRDALDELRVTDVHGEAIEFSRPSGYEEQRVEWAVPPTQTVLVAFDQDLDRSYGWGRQYVELRWAHQFAIPVERMRVSARVSGPVEDEDGFACVPEGERMRCNRVGGAFAVERMPAGPYDDGLALRVLAGMFALFLGFAGLRLRRLWATYLDWYGDSKSPKPVKLKDRKASRIPPPLPSPASPTLSAAKRREFFVNQAAVLLAPLLGCGAMALLGRSELPLGWSVVLVGAVMIGFCAAHLARVRPPDAVPFILFGALWTAVLVRFGAYAVYLAAPSVLVYGGMIIALREARSKPRPPKPAPKPSASKPRRAPTAIPSLTYKPPKQPKPAPQQRASSSFDWDFTSSCGGGGCGGCGG